MLKPEGAYLFYCSYFLFVYMYEFLCATMCEEMSEETYHVGPTVKLSTPNSAASTFIG